MLPSFRVARSTASERLRRLVWLAVGAAALFFAIQGGEYSTVDLIRQHRQRQRLVREIDSLRQDPAVVLEEGAQLVDSLGKYKQRVLTDPKAQERLAREEFGMVRGKELLYRIVEPDSQ